jgi:phosphohistidine phosphatase
MAICSAAVRTRQTTELIVEAMGGRLPVDSYRSLYEADTDLVLQYLREVDEGVRSVLVVGHNPAMYRLAWALTDTQAADDDDEDPTGAHAVLAAHGFPTCALAALALEVGAWEDVAHGCGRLAGLFRPPY